MRRRGTMALLAVLAISGAQSCAKPHYVRAVQTITADRERQVVVMGRITWGHVSTLRTHGLLPVRALFAGEPESTDKILVNRYYATCRLLVHYLLSDHGQAFELYQRRLREGAEP